MAIEYTMTREKVVDLLAESFADDETYMNFYYGFLEPEYGEEEASILRDEARVFARKHGYTCCRWDSLPT